MPSPVSIFLDFNLPNATTWFYFSFLLAIALFFKFSRLLSVRNLDVVMMVTLVPVPGGPMAWPFMFNTPAFRFNVEAMVVPVAVATLAEVMSPLRFAVPPLTLPAAPRLPLPAVPLLPVMTLIPPEPPLPLASLISSLLLPQAATPTDSARTASDSRPAELFARNADDSVSE